MHIEAMPRVPVLLASQLIIKCEVLEKKSKERWQDGLRKNGWMNK